MNKIFKVFLCLMVALCVVLPVSATPYFKQAPYWIDKVDTDGNGNVALWTKISLDPNSTNVFYITLVDDNISQKPTQVFEWFIDFSDPNTYNYYRYGDLAPNIQPYELNGINGIDIRTTNETTILYTPKYYTTNDINVYLEYAVFSDTSSDQTRVRWNDASSGDLVLRGTDLIDTATGNIITTNETGKIYLMKESNPDVDMVSIMSNGVLTGSFVIPENLTTTRGNPAVQVGEFGRISHIALFRAFGTKYIPIHWSYNITKISDTQYKVEFNNPYTEYYSNYQVKLYVPDEIANSPGLVISSTQNSAISMVIKDKIYPSFNIASIAFLILAAVGIILAVVFTLSGNEVSGQEGTRLVDVVMYILFGGVILMVAAIVVAHLAGVF